MEKNVEIISVSNLKKHYEIKTGAFNKKRLLKAVDGLSFKINRDKVFALVGESGCGKSTVARTLLLLVNKTDGKILFNNKDISTLKGNGLKVYRKSVQIIFQDPFASLNPRMTIYETLSEPLKVHNTVPRKHYREKTAQVLESVGLNTDVMSRYPHEFSGGQRQRICIARALTLNPEVIVADEPLSSLDVSIQAQILNLLKELKNKNSLSFLFISHDLNIVQYFSDEVAVMYLGKIVEKASTDKLFQNPLHPYTQMLLNSVPKINSVKKDNPVDSRPLEIAGGDSPSPLNIPDGCPFHPRCPECFDACKQIVPRLELHKDRDIACHLYNGSFT